MLPIKNKSAHLNESYKELHFYATRPTNNDDNKEKPRRFFDCMKRISGAKMRRIRP
jgi:hypothetical protein